RLCAQETRATFRFQRLDFLKKGRDIRRRGSKTYKTKFELQSPPVKRFSHVQQFQLAFSRADDPRVQKHAGTRIHVRRRLEKGKPQGMGGQPRFSRVRSDQAFRVSRVAKNPVGSWQREIFKAG